MRLSLLSLFSVLICSAPSLWGKDLLLISAMPQELRVMENLIGNQSQKSNSPLMTKTGQYRNLSVVTSMVGVGKVRSAMNTQKLIHDFSPQAIIFSGVAGAINRSYKIGDIVIGTSVFQHDYGFLGDEGLVVRAPGTMPELGMGTGQESIYQDLNIEPLGLKPAELMKNLRPVQSTSGRINPRIHLGRIATGDQFVSSKQKKRKLQELGADAVEMEGASVCFVASQNKIPCYIIRAMSDSAGEEAVTDFPAFLSVVAQNNGKILESILNNSDFSNSIKRKKK